MDYDVSVNVRASVLFDCNGTPKQLQYVRNYPASTTKGEVDSDIEAFGREMELSITYGYRPWGERFSQCAFTGYEYQSPTYWEQNLGM